MIQIELNTKQRVKVAISGKGIDVLLDVTELTANIAQSAPEVFVIMEMILEVNRSADAKQEPEEMLAKLIPHLEQLNALLDQ